MSKEAVRLKEEGNVCFREKRYHKAIELYSQSLQVEQSATVLGIFHIFLAVFILHRGAASYFCTLHESESWIQTLQDVLPFLGYIHKCLCLANRAQSHLNLEQWAKAIMDCNRALEIDSKMEKVLYRRAQALEKIGLKASAHKDLERCLEIAPSSAVKAMIEKLANKQDAEVIDVPCVEKGDEIRSDSDFVEIAIDIPRQSVEKVEESAVGGVWDERNSAFQPPKPPIFRCFSGFRRPNLMI
ncbi:hypothetical protein Y032_0357g3383 [Ancylostoma ceylanicum]|uniref:Tetratricopeptide repeat protein n=2 Tax=Ancylostoma ceylanicum TaxID=53326 RepID=A0A016RW58_9BILA|nr:hypothetical protein Y032_0357g3383 [Ancylostoma ceylanicum]